MKVCEVCSKSGEDAKKCAFEKCCSCWYGIPCVNGESIRKVRQRNAARREREAMMRPLGLVKVRGALGGTYWE